MSKAKRAKSTVATSVRAHGTSRAPGPWLLAGSGVVATVLGYLKLDKWERVGFGAVIVLLAVYAGYRSPRSRRNIVLAVAVGLLASANATYGVIQVTSAKDPVVQAVCSDVEAVRKSMTSFLENAREHTGFVAPEFSGDLWKPVVDEINKLQRSSAALSNEWLRNRSNDVASHWLALAGLKGPTGLTNENHLEAGSAALTAMHEYCVKEHLLPALIGSDSWFRRDELCRYTSIAVRTLDGSIETQPAVGPLAPLRDYIWKIHADRVVANEKLSEADQKLQADVLTWVILTERFLAHGDDEDRRVARETYLRIAAACAREPSPISLPSLPSGF